jgi:hypothetical protein
MGADLSEILYFIVVLGWLGLVTLPLAAVGQLVGMTAEQGCNLGLGGLRQQRSRAGAQNLGQRIGKVPGWESWKTLVSVTAYHFFAGEVEASNTPTIRRLILHAVTNFRP